MNQRIGEKSERPSLPVDPFRHRSAINHAAEKNMTESLLRQHGLEVAGDVPLLSAPAAKPLLSPVPESPLLNAHSEAGDTTDRPRYIGTAAMDAPGPRK